MSLEAIATSRFSIERAGRVATLDDLLRAAEAERDAIVRAAPEHHVVQLPARDPVRLLALMEACWRTGRVPLPVGGVAEPLPASLPPTTGALVLRTSGSTGAAKYPVFSGGSVCLSAARIARRLGTTAEDRVALVQTADTGFTLVGQLLAAATAGASVIVVESPFPLERVELISSRQATMLSAVPFVLQQLVDAGLAGDTLRSIGAAGARLPGRLAERLLSTNQQATVWSQYGCTEAGPRLAAIDVRDGAFAAGAVGRAIEGVTLSIVDGEVVFQTDTAMLEYLGDPEATDAAREGDGWRTGDLGSLDATGALTISARRDAVVKFRGTKVSLDAVATAAEACGAAAAIALFVPEPEQLALLVSGRTVPSRRALSEHLPLEAIPTRVHRVDALPRLPGGKLDRVAAARLLQDLS